MQEGPFTKKMCTKRKLLGNFPRSDSHLPLKYPRKVLRRFKSTSKANFLDRHFRITQQIDRFVDTNLIQVIQRRQIQVLRKQLTKIPLSHSCLNSHIGNGDICLVVQADIGNCFFQRLVCTYRQVGLDRKSVV